MPVHKVGRSWKFRQSEVDSGGVPVRRAKRRIEKGLLVCQPQSAIRRIRPMGANMRIMDGAFEYPTPGAARKSGRFLAPPSAIDTCVKMPNPTK